jgi:hypothetical protein
MKMHLASVMALVLVLGGSAAQAQSLSELFEKAIYTEETLGNVEGAIRIYEQIISGSIPGTDIRQQAQRRLAAARLYLKNTPSLPLGTFDGRTYRHTRTGLSFNLPPRWVVTNTHPSSNDGEGVNIAAVEPEAQVAVWMIPEGNDAQSINEKLDGSPAMKLADRKGTHPNYRYRPGSIQRLVINGKPAMMVIADYGDERPYVEYLTWIYTERTHTFFYGSTELHNFDRFRPQFERLLQSTNIP